MDLPSAAAAALAAAAENDDALAAAHAGPSPTGRLLVLPGAGAQQRGEDAEVLDVDALLPGEQAHELKVAPVVGVRTPLAQTHDRRIAVSSRYVCYGLPQGIVRALDRRSGGRALFRGHAQPIADAAFFRNEEDQNDDNDDTTPQLLATASVGGDVIVRSVSTPSAADEAAPEDSVLLRATAPRGSSGSSSPPPRLAWHPTEPRVLAVAGGDRVALLVVPEPGTTAASADAVVDASSGASLVLPLPAESAGAAVTALAFAPGGQALAAADSAGYVTCWRLDGGAADDAPSARWRPFSDAAAAADGADPAPGALLWLDGSGSLLTGDGRNRVLRLWRVDSSAAQPPRLLQTVELRASAASSSASAFFNQAALNRRLGLVVLANAANPGAGTAAQGAVATLHYRLGAASSTPAALDYLALFSTRHPCMSVAAAAETAGDDAAGGPPRPALLLWAVQPEAVQRYALEPALARPPPGAVAEAAAAAVAAKPPASAAAPPPPPPVPAPVAAAAAADEDDDDEGQETRRAPLAPPRAPQVPEVPASSGILAAAHHHHHHHHNLAASAPVVSAAATNGQQQQQQQLRPASSSAPGAAAATGSPATATATTTTLDASAVASAVQAQVAAANAELLSEVRGELARALRALEVGVSAKLEAKMEAQLKAAQRRAEDDDKKRAASAKKASADAERALAAAVTKAASDAAQAQLRLVPQALAQALPQALAQADVSPGMAAALEPALRSALRDAFSATVVPAYERATQAMFGQIESALRNWAQHGQQQQHQALQQFLQQQQQQLQQQQQRGPPPPPPMMVGGPPPMGGPPPPMMGGPPPPPHMAPPPPPPPPDPRVALQALLASGQIESAFAQALSLASLEAVVWLCRQAGPAAQVAGREPCPLSQVVLLSLTQQLAADLRADADAALKLDWLSECAPLLQPRDPSVAPHLRGALAPAVPGLRALAAGGQGIDPALAKRAKTVVHLFNSLMHQ